MAFYENPSFQDGFDSRRFFDEGFDSLQERQPCPVCGHPTGDCAGDSGPPQKITGLGITEEYKKKQTILVEEDVYEERQITPFVKVKAIKYKRGSHIPYEEAERLGLV